MKVIHHIKIHKRLSQVSLISGFLFCLLVLATFYPLESKNEHSTEAATGTAQSSSLTLDVTSSVASVDLTVDSSTGTFASSDTNAAFSVTTNNFTGYTLSISADEDTGLLSDDEANTLSSIPAAISEETFSASTNTSYNGMWGYRPSKYNSAANTNYLPAPTTTASTLDVTSTANTTANNYTIALGARADFTKPASAYTNTFTITAVSNPINYVINYNSNTTDTVTDMPATQSSSTSATSIILSNNTPKRDHYTFTGWCSTTPTTNNGVDTCNGNDATGGPATVYLPGATYGIDQTTLNDTTFYAMWKIDTFVQTTQVRYENADGTWTAYTTAEQKTVNYGSDYSWSTSQITDFNSAAYKAANVASYTVTADKTNQVSIYRNTFTCNIQSRFQNADGTYGSYTTRVNETRRYGQTCSWSTANISNFDSTTYKAASYTNNSITANVNQSINIDRNTFACTARYRLQNADGTYPTTYTSAGTVNSAALYGSTCSYTTNQNTTQYQNKTASATVTKATTLSVDVPRATYACKAQYRLQAANGTYPSSYTTVTVNSAALYGSTCSYTTTQNTTQYTNQTKSATVTGATTLTVPDVPRKTYKLTVTASTNTSSPTGAGTYRWGQTVAVGVTKAANTTCISYAAPTWTKTAGTLSSTSGTSVNFTMPTSAATVTATSTATNNKQTITLSRSNASSISIGGTAYTATSVQLTCGTYNITGAFPTGYTFSKWAVSGTNNTNTVGSTTTLATTYKVNGPGTIALTGTAKTNLALTVNFNTSHVSQVVVREGSTTGTVKATLTTSGKVSNLTYNKNYYLIPTYKSGYELSSWAKASGAVGTLSSTTAANPYYKIGDGTNTVTLTAKTAYPIMQDYTKATCQSEASSANVTVVDTRDNNSYTVRYINGNCWMTQNLRIAGGKTLTSADSNVSSNYTIPTTDLTSGNTYTEGRIHNSGNTTNGYWYNYCAASAGTICTDSNSIQSTYDICPKGWRLPTYAEAQTIGNGNNTYVSAFSPVAGGYYYDGSLDTTGRGYWWSRSAYNTAARYGLRYYDSSLDIYYNSRNCGYYVRCIRSS